jgi:hypothetical protein
MIKEIYFSTSKTIKMISFYLVDLCEKDEHEINSDTRMIRHLDH